eukprot:6837134-Prymnesium_polylepis.1
MCIRDRPPGARRCAPPIGGARAAGERCVRRRRRPARPGRPHGRGRRACARRAGASCTPCD